MFKHTIEAHDYRALLTETLPYEVPVIFSNDVFFASLVKKSDKPSVGVIISKIREKNTKYYIPYNYRISKDDKRYTTLSIMHPSQQGKFNEFYKLYSQSIIDHCAMSEVSLRRPVAEMDVFSNHSLEVEPSPRIGIPHIMPGDGQIDVSKMVSYFTYSPYNLLYKFVESSEYRKLEKKFKLLRTLDISRCFFNIYTHSIGWAIKGKEYAKDNTGVYSFESVFDRLMQQANYNETNGILVGPEVSRIFAEVILQDIDLRIIQALNPKQHNRDYAIRRYVDDFYVFASNQDVIEDITSHIVTELENYKLFLNEEKTDTFTRPFVSSLTLARSELKSLVSAMHDSLDLLNEKRDEADAVRSSNRKLRRLTQEVRLVSERHRVGFSSLSGWLFSTLRAVLRRLVGIIRQSQDADAHAALLDTAITVIEISFYIASMDTRVRASYSICHIVESLSILGGSSAVEGFNRIEHVVSDEIDQLISSILVDKRDGDDDVVELFNFMILGCHFMGRDFLRKSSMVLALKRIFERPLTYFSYITAKFCLLKNPISNRKMLIDLNERLLDRLARNDFEIAASAELYLLACDYLSSPDVSAADKRKLVEKLCGGQPSSADAEEVGRYLGFVDWSGLRIKHILGRKELRPVYSWS